MISHTLHFTIVAASLLVLQGSASIASIIETSPQPLPTISLELGTTPLDYWTRQAAKGSARAQFHLAEIYHYGTEKIPKDRARAAKWYSLAADQGHAEAELRLSKLYAMGAGVDQDDAAMLKWLKASAEHFNAYAQNTLGLEYFRGSSTTKDDREAAKWFRAAAEQGYGYGQLNLGQCLRDGIGVPQDLRNRSQGACNLTYYRCYAGMLRQLTV